MSEECKCDDDVIPWHNNPECPQFKAQSSFDAPAGSLFPFECENCGHKPTPQEVLDHHGDCAKCRDTVITYTVDAAECIVRLMANCD